MKSQDRLPINGLGYSSLLKVKLTNAGMSLNLEGSIPFAIFKNSRDDSGRGIIEW